ncbi:MAG: GFA family protein, partial [Rhodospirillaceae bacterium]|nr:GFA family protein [Rhodospirillaceae bacterium]
MSYESDGWAGEVHIFVAALDDPEALQPRLHAYVVDQLSWIHTDDGLRRYHQTAAEGDPLPG